MPNNRELAVLFYVLVVFICLLWSSKTRSSFLDCFRAFFDRKLCKVWLLVVVWFAVSLTILSQLKLWSLSQMTSSIFWLVSAVSLVGAALTKEDPYRSYRSVFKGQVVLVFFLAYLVEAYVFPFWVELLLLPFLAFLSALLATIGYKRDIKNVEEVESLLHGVQTAVVIMMLLFFLVRVVIDYSDFFSLSTLRSLLLAPALSVLFLPLIFFVSVWQRYDRVFSVYSIFLERAPSMSVKIATLFRIGVRGSAIENWRRYAFRVFTIGDINNDADVIKHIDDYKKNADSARE